MTKMIQFIVFDYGKRPKTIAEVSNRALVFLYRMMQESIMILRNDQKNKMEKYNNFS